VTISKPEKFSVLVKAISELDYCQIIQEDIWKRTVTVELSFSKFFENSNIYLISSKDEAFKVQEAFSDKMREHHLDSNVFIRVIRINTTFKYTMDFNEDFNHFLNVFIYAAKIFHLKNDNTYPLNAQDLISRQSEIITLGNKLFSTNTPEVSIYKHELRFFDKPTYYLYGKSRQKNIWFEISREVMEPLSPLSKFERYDYYGKYYSMFYQYIMENLFDLDALTRIQEEEVKELVELLQVEKNKPGFTYKSFIFANIHLIHNYKVLRKAMELTIENPKSLEKAITTVRKLLKNMEKQYNLSIMDTLKKFHSIKNSIRKF
jgi:hypothetical protein